MWYVCRVGNRWDPILSVVDRIGCKYFLIRLILYSFLWSPLFYSNSSVTVMSDRMTLSSGLMILSAWSLLPLMGKRLAYLGAELMLTVRSKIDRKRS